MEKKFNDSSSALARFGRDKRVRTATAASERVERRPRANRSDEEGRASYDRERRDRNGEDRPKRNSYHPYFTADNRPRFEHDRTDRPARPERPAYGERGDRSFSDRTARPRSYGEQGERDERRPYGSRGPKPAYGNRSGEGRSYGSKPYGEKTYGRKPFGGRSTDERPSFDDREGRPEKPFGKKPYGKRTEGKPYAGKGGKSYRRNDEQPRSYPKFAAEPITGEIRLNRFLAQSGLCSRREADDFITAGLVTVNGEIVTQLGTKIKPTDEVKFNDSRVQGEKKVYLVLNKPKGYVTTLEDSHADKLVIDLVKGACTERIYPVGRLDKNSLGLLLFTNDGDLTKTLTHPSYQKKKIYQVSLDKPLTRADMDRLAEGITLEDGEIYADEISYLKDNKQEVGIEIHSGRNRIVRRMFEFLGYTVTKLDRVYYAGLTKKNLKRGAWRFLTREEVDRLKSGMYE